MDVFGQMEFGLLPDAHESQKFPLIDGRQVDAQFLPDPRAMGFVEAAQQRHDVLLLVSGRLATGLHHLHHLGLGQET